MSKLLADSRFPQEIGFLRQSNPGSDTLPGKILKEDTLECFSRNQALYRVLLTETDIFLQLLKHPQHFERYELEDLFGVQTYRHRKNKCESSSKAAYICFTFYSRVKRGVITSSKFRERTQIVFEVRKSGFSFKENLEQASSWKDICTRLLHSKYPKWQLERMTSSPSESLTMPTEQNIGVDTNKKEKLEGYSSQDISDWGLVSSEDRANPDAATHELIISLTNQVLLLRKFVVILNPKSGQGKTLNIFRETVYPILCESGIKPILLVTQRPGHARSVVSSADLSDVHGIITVGGDGLLYEVVNGLRCRVDSQCYTDIPVGIIAGGSGNGLARSIASYSGESEDYLRNPVLVTTLAVARGRVVPVNLLEVDLDLRKVYAFLSVGWGILSDIDIESEVIRSFGEIRFTLWSVFRVAKLRTYSAQVAYSKAMESGAKSEGRKVIQGDFVSVYASCQSHIGSDIIFAPDATPNDGLIHLTIARGNIGRARITQFLLGLDKGSHINVPGVEYVKVDEFSIYREGGISGTLTLDGEKVVGENITIRLASQPLKVFAL